MPLHIFQVNKQTVHIKSIIHSSIAMIFQKKYTQAGFEPGSSVPEAEAVSTAAT
jgi:hypothetical protein